MFFRELVRGLAKRRPLVKSVKILNGGLVRISSRLELEQRSYLEISYSHLQTSCVEISCRHLVQIATLQRDLAQQLLQKLSRRSCTRCPTDKDLRQGNLQNLKTGISSASSLQDRLESLVLVPGIEIPNPRFQIRDPRSKIQLPRIEIPDPRSEL